MRVPHRLRVLLVEDNQLDRRVIVRHLEHDETTSYDLHVEETLDGAIAALNHGTDCILLDLSLPDSEGLASIDALLDRAPGVAIVVLTGLDDAAVAVEAVEHGAQDYLTKNNATPELVSRAIRYAVARQHGDAQLRSTQDLVGVLRDRERIGRDMHDTVIQQLFATGMKLQAAAARSNDESTSEAILDAVSGIDGAIRELREAISGMRSAQDDDPLSTAIGTVARREIASLNCEPTIRVAPNVDALDGVPRHELLAVLREALSNVAKHAHATTCQVMVELEGDELVLRVVDNGVGLGHPAARPADQLSGRGLGNMAQRARNLSGSLTLRPGPGGGTALEWRVRLSDR